jgi:hypothetical protein
MDFFYMHESEVNAGQDMANICRQMVSKSKLPYAGRVILASFGVQMDSGDFRPDQLVPVTIPAGYKLLFPNVYNYEIFLVSPENKKLVKIEISKYDMLSPEFHTSLV